MAKSDGSPAHAGRFETSSVGFTNNQLAIERAYLLIDNYIAEMAERETKAALAGIKTALRARAGQPALAK